jgi:Family of unknown function (DUF6920)
MTGMDEPVQRYLTHAIGGAAVGPMGMRLTMAGRINVGRWLSFTAEQLFSGHAFIWRARAGWTHWKPLSVLDSYGDGTGTTDGRLFGRVRFMHAHDENTARAAAGRAAAESIWVPGLLLPRRGVSWRAESDELIVAGIDVPPERPEVSMRIDAAGALRSVSLLRWGNAGQEGFGYIPFGGDIHAERAFGDLVLPSQITVGWWYGTTRYAPMFEVTITDAVPYDGELAAPA